MSRLVRICGQVKPQRVPPRSPLATRVVIPVQAWSVAELAKIAGRCKNPYFEVHSDRQTKTSHSMNLTREAPMNLSQLTVDCQDRHIEKKDIGPTGLSFHKSSFGFVRVLPSTDGSSPQQMESRVRATTRWCLVRFDVTHFFSVPIKLLRRYARCPITTSTLSQLTLLIPGHTKWKNGRPRHFEKPLLLLALNVRSPCLRINRGVQRSVTTTVLRFYGAQTCVNNNSLTFKRMTRVNPHTNFFFIAKA